uniref:Transmembrane protein 183-like n=1 Tax=Sinocyclocheilus anshuiensis TaxID=1608454 RepID=A0A671S1J8_9TELE
MPKKGNRKRLKFRAEDVCSESVTVADYANTYPAIVKSGRVKKYPDLNSVSVKLLCGLEASQGPVQEVLSSAVGVSNAALESSDELNSEEGDEIKGSRKKKNKRHKENSGSIDGEEYPIDIWLLLAAYIRPEDVCRFSVICKNAWTATHYNLDADLPDRLQPDCITLQMRCLRARVIRSLFHLYEPFSLRVSKSPPLPESTPTTLLNSKCLLFWVNKVSGSRSEPMWEFNFKFVKLPTKGKNGCSLSLQLPRQYNDVHTNPDSDCYLLRVTTLNFIFTSVVMGMTLTLFTINVSTDMRHHRVRLEFQDSPVIRGKKLRGEQGVQVVLDPVHSVRLIDWWHPQYPTSSYN